MQENPVVYFEVQLGRYAGMASCLICESMPATSVVVRATNIHFYHCHRRRLITRKHIADAVPLGRITVELKADVTPKTAENFLQLAQAEPGSGFALSRFHRIIPNFMCQV